MLIVFQNQFNPQDLARLTELSSCSDAMLRSRPNQQAHDKKTFLSSLLLASHPLALFTHMYWHWYLLLMYTIRCLYYKYNVFLFCQQPLDSLYFISFPFSTILKWLFPFNLMIVLIIVLKLRSKVRYSILYSLLATKSFLKKNRLQNKIKPKLYSSLNCCKTLFIILCCFMNNIIPEKTLFGV